MDKPLRSPRVLFACLGYLLMTSAGSGGQCSAPSPDSALSTTRPAPGDRGVAIRRHLPDFTFDAESGEYGTDEIRSGGQPMLSWDGLVRFTYKTVVEGQTRFSGLVAEVVDYANFQRHENGNVGWKHYASAAHPRGFPVWKTLWFDETNQVYSRTLTAPFSDWTITLDDPLHAPDGVGTGLTHLFHTTITPAPERTSENPFLSSADGGPPDGSRHMTYEFLMLATAVWLPESFDADFDEAHDYHTTGLRQRLVTGLGRVTVRFESGPGGQRMPVEVVAADLDENTFSVVQTPTSAPGARRVLRGFEASITRDGNVLVFHSQAYTYTNDPAGAAPRSGHVLFSRRLQGSFAEPTGATPLRFSEPEPISSLVDYANMLVPRSYDGGPEPAPRVTYGERYPLFRHRLTTPLGDHVYASNEPVGGAYPWISLDGGTLAMSTAKGVGDYLDLNPTTTSIHQSGGIDFCLAGNYCDPPAIFRPFPQRRAGFVFFGEDLIVDRGTEQLHQMKVWDHPLNETRRSLSRITLNAFRADGPWSPYLRLPASVADRVRTRPESNSTIVYNSVNNQSFGIPFLGALGTISGEVAHPEELEHFLLYSGLIASGPWIEDLHFEPDGSGALHSMRPAEPPPSENYSRYGTTLLTDFTRAFDVSGNQLRVDLNFSGTGGAFYPFNDPVGSYGSPLGDHERELQIGRVGQGVYLSSDGAITISEDGASRPGALGDYTNELAVQFWVKPLVDDLDARLASGPAFELRSKGTDGLVVRGRVQGAADLVVRVPRRLERDAWCHVLLNQRVDPATGRHALELYLNGERVLGRSSTTPGTSALAQAATPTEFGPGGAGTTPDRVMILDELAIANRALDDVEVRRLALRPETRVAPDALGRLGSLEATITALGLDPLEAWVPSANPVTDAKIALGKRLFFDEALSTSGTISCASCHPPQSGFGDPSALSTGTLGSQTPRHSPPIVNRIFQRRDDLFGWDGRGQSLEEQVLFPFSDPIEMNIGVGPVVASVRTRGAAYDAEVASAFGHDAASFDAEELAFALATYVRSLVVGSSNFELWRRGDGSTLDAQEQRGLGLYESSCIACHHGANFSDNDFHDVGLYDSAAPGADLGRGALTDRRPDRGAFRTPGLRDLDLHVDVLGHDGSRTLDAVLMSYGSGGAFHDNTARDRRVRNFGFTAAERADLRAFLLGGLRSNERSVYGHTSPWK